MSGKAGDAHWVIETVRTWATQHPISDAAPAALQRLITEIAAYRERAGHNSTDPLGPPPDNPPHLERWQHLDTRLNKPATARISDLLTRQPGGLLSNGAKVADKRSTNTP